MTPWTRWTTTAALASALVLVPTAAHADTSTASARALGVTTSLGVGVGSSTVSATSDGTSPDTGGGSGGAPAQDVVTAGLVVSKVRALADGTSAACAGLVGSGGSIQIGADGSCAVSAGSGGVRIALTPLVTVTADALVASCTASSTAPGATRTVVTNARLTAPLLSTGISAGQASAGIPGVLALGTGGSSTIAAAGSGGTTALTASVIGGTAAVDVGRVSCGQNAVVVPTPALPLEGWPVSLAGAALAVVAGRALLRRARTHAHAHAHAPQDGASA